MAENQEKIAGEEEVGATASPETAETEKPVEAQETDKADDDKESTAEKKTFTQEKLNELIKERLERQSRNFYETYGVKDEAELKELVARSKEYDTLLQQYNDLKVEHSQVLEKNAFVENNIDPKRYEDVRIYFKGKELQFNNENLVQELATHQEWIKQAEKPQTTIASLGAEHKAKATEDDDAKLKRIYGSIY